MYLLTAIDVNVQNDTWSILVAIATIIAALGTIGAVVVALFLPVWAERRKQPKLTLTEVPEKAGRLYDGEDAPVIFDGPQLLLANEAGRDTARGVEVLASVYMRDPSVILGDEKVILFEDVALNHNANDGTRGRPSSNVGPGATRRLYLARLGEPQNIYDSWCSVREPDDGPVFRSDWCGAWATVPARQDQMHWIESDTEYILDLLVTGDNFDAFRMRGAVIVAREDWSHEAVAKDLSRPVLIEFRWTEPLKKARDRIELVD